MNLYQEEILDHYKHPRHKGLLDTVTHQSVAVNQLCGDTLRLQIVLENDLIARIGFEGDGCAISQAAMSMLCEELAGKTLKEARLIDDASVIDLLGVEIGPSRLKCALLSLQALRLLLNQIYEK